VQIANALSEAGLWEVSALEFQAVPPTIDLALPGATGGDAEARGNTEGGGLHGH
jgi:hypothetical protein